MNKHDKIVLKVARKELKDGSEAVYIGGKVIAKKIIAEKLANEFPDRKIAYWSKRNNKTVAIMTAPRITVKVTYKGFDKKLNKIIERTMKKAGLKFYASGFDLKTEERDICFDYMKYV